MASLGLKLKLPKTCEKQLYETPHRYSMLKTAQITPNIRERKVSKSGKIGHFPKAIALLNCQFAARLKIAKSMRKRTLQPRYSGSLQKKKRLDKTPIAPNIRKIPCKGRSLYKMVTSGQKFKLSKTC